MLDLVPDDPEMLIAGKDEQWLRYFFSDRTYDPATIIGGAFDSYFRVYRGTGGNRFDFRASAEDMAKMQQTPAGLR